MEGVGTFYGHLVFLLLFWYIFMAIWYVFGNFGIFFPNILHQEKSDQMSL
jgi:hypothetical protein